MNRSKSTTTIISHSSLIDLTLEYSQPLKRGREIFGSVVPFGQLWRAGANGCTTIFTSQDLRFESGTLPRGKYALYVVPWPEGWTIVFYSDTSNYGLPRRWNKSAVALSLDVPLRTLDQAVEVLQICIEQKSHFEASLEIAWDKTSISAPFEIPSQSDALEDAFPASGGPSFDDYYMAAKFCYETADFRGALMRIDMGLELNQRKPYFYLQLKALVEAKLGNTDSAIQYAQLAAQGAREAGDVYFAQSVDSTIAELSPSSAGTTSLGEVDA